jgi:hypothetical protein
VSNDRIKKAYELGRQFGYGVNDMEWLSLPDMSPDEEKAFADGYFETVGANKLEAVAFASVLFLSILLMGVFAWWLIG